MLCQDPVWDCRNHSKSSWTPEVTNVLAFGPFLLWDQRQYDGHVACRTPMQLLLVMSSFLARALVFRGFLKSPRRQPKSSLRLFFEIESLTKAALPSHVAGQEQLATAAAEALELEISGSFWPLK